jgi:hypothetical protein
MDAISNNSEWSSLPPSSNAPFTFAHPALPNGETPWFYHAEFVHFVPLAGLTYRGYQYLGMCGDERVPQLDFTTYHDVTSGPPYTVLHTVPGQDGVAYPTYQNQVVFLPNTAQATAADGTTHMHLDPAQFAQYFVQNDSEYMQMDPVEHAQGISEYDPVDMIMEPADDALFIPGIESEDMSSDVAHHGQGSYDSETMAQYLADQAQTLSDAESYVSSEWLAHLQNMLESESADIPMDPADHAQDVHQSQTMDMHLDIAGPLPQNGMWEIEVDNTMSHDELEAAAHIQDQILALVDN